jgi:hypothetical protein
MSGAPMTNKRMVLTGPDIFFSINALQIVKSPPF